MSEEILLGIIVTIYGLFVLLFIVYDLFYGPASKQWKEVPSTIAGVRSQ